MKKVRAIAEVLIWVLIGYSIAAVLTSCEPCYECERLCMDCTSGAVTNYACTNDSVSAADVEEAYDFLVSFGHDCEYTSKDLVEVCGKEEAQQKELDGFQCRGKGD